MQVGAVLGLDRSKGLVKRFEAKAASSKLQDKMAAVRMELKDSKQLQVRCLFFPFSHMILMALLI